MSSHLHVEMIRAREHEIAAGAVHAHHRYELPATAGRTRRTTRSRVRQALAGAVATAALCLALTTALASSAAHASRPSAQARPATASMRKLESQGYVERSCTTKGILMINRRTGRVTTVAY
jgi:hypothetical protein